MKKLVKPLTIIAGIVALLLIGVASFVHLYLTDERIKTLIIPPAEKTLGRKVTIGDISVSIFSGITIHDLAIKEQDKKKDFVTIGKFILRYDLLPLLQKQIAISQVLIADPHIQIFRNKKGKFNYETLAVLVEDKPATQKSKKKTTPADKEGGLPLALTVQEVRVDNAIINVTDAKGEIPTASVTVNTSVAVTIGADGMLTYKGDIKAGIDTVYGKIKPEVSLAGQFDQSNLDYSADIIIEGQKIKVAGQIKDYAGSPDVLLKITSDILDLDKLAALPDKLPQTPSATMVTNQTQPVKSLTPQKKSTTTKPQQTASPAPPVHGKVNIRQAAYNHLAVNSFSLAYTFKNNVLAIRDLTAEVASGNITGQADVDLNHPDLSFKGKLGADSLQLTEILNAFAPKVAKTLSGGVSTSFTFSGKNTEWEKLREALNVDGTLSIKNGHFHNTPMTSAIANLLDLEELNDLSFKESGGTFQVRNGKARLTSSISGSDVSVDGDGFIGLDGTLDFPMTLRFSPKLSAKLKQRASFAKYLTDKKGETTLHLKVKGTVDKPRPSIDTTGLQKQAEEQVKKEIQNKAQEELKRTIEKHLGKDAQTAPLEDAAKKLLEGLFGK
jgi:uncharacterized protein involved in outer membrane biogenesis